MGPNGDMTAIGPMSNLLAIIEGRQISSKRGVVFVKNNYIFVKINTAL
jgi:hypothetical protein